MPESLPSAKTVIADVPEVRDFKTKFTYNFFQPDERVNDSGRVTTDSIRLRPSENFDAPFVESDRFNRFTSRFITLDWRPVVENQTFSPPGFTIAGNIDKIHEEQHFIGDDYSNVSFQDLGADEKVKFFVQQLVERQAERDRPEAFVVTSSVVESPLDLVKRLNSRTSGTIDPAILCEALTQPDVEGYVFRDTQGMIIDNGTLLKELKNVRFFSQVNNKVMAEILRTVSDNSMSVFADEIDAFIGAIELIQEKAISEQGSSVLDSRNYDLEIAEYIDYEPLDVHGHEPKVEIVGYLIEKVEITPDGNAVVQDPIVIENPNIATTIDIRIKYGSTYKYTIRSIALFETQADDIDTGEPVVLKYLVASKASPLQLVECIERTPPPPPADFNVRWDAVEKAAILEWCFPVNPKRDIKGWQVFRRATIDEPFELQAAFDFDDSVIKGLDPRADQPDEVLVKRLTSPQNFYLDRGFTKNSTYIYAVCSVDARGLGSNYSLQMQASFDKFQNRLKKTFVSPSNAPKPYPNFFLAEDTFVDTIRDSGHKKLRIVFNPEYLKVVDSDANDLRLLKLDTDANYQLSMINVDLQLQENINIKLLDKRLSSDQNMSVIQKRLLHNRRDVFDRLRKSLNRK